MLLAGMPGCGKSMSAKAASSLFNVPLFRLDIGSLMGKFVGESEANMKAALKVAEQASPCVLWVDELEKAFSGINGAGGSAEITTRLFGYFLTWMQEKPGAVFVIATANDITNIPPELLRRGRFDEIFYVNLPSERERKQIFHVKTKQLKTTPRGLDLAELATLSEGFSGADIECVVNDALESLFRCNESVLTQALIKKHIDLITPISIVLKEKISIYQALFEKFSLKAASLADEDLDSIDALSDSNALSDRENAASNEFISSEKLIELVKDQSPLVRQAAIKNPHCPHEALQQVVSRYRKFDFNKPGSWSDNEVTKKSSSWHCSIPI
ncbi:AAA family ATPase [Vibrio parahaemolyticus]|nr:AAA family ATPase [Vibrio parahaemolyticus]